MQDAISLEAPVVGRRTRFSSLARASAPTLAEAALALASALLLVLSFPDFNLWPLAWVGLAPVIYGVARRPRPRQAFVLGWMTGTAFFYGSCYWVTHAMIHFGGIPAPAAYMLLAPLTVLVGLFPAAWAFALARACTRWGAKGVALAPLAWVSLEWARLATTGQLWNAIGYSQAYVPALIQPARWGGVYAVGFLALTVNAAVAYLLLRRDRRALLVTGAALGLVALTLFLSARVVTRRAVEVGPPSAVVVAVQPNVAANFGRSAAETAALVTRHLSMSEQALNEWGRTTPARGTPSRLVIWPESPMNFTYASDARFREVVGAFARAHEASVLFNSLEPAPAGGAYNSAVLVDEAGRRVAQYDKIRLLPFGEYVPLPRWLPPAWLLTGIVGDFTPGDKYPLMPVGAGGERLRIGVFICFESAFPSIARTFARDGADVLVNISNDGYLGRTPVLRQHLANVVFRAVENERPVARVTNTGITALVTPRGEVLDATRPFEAASRTWEVGPANGGRTFYTRHGDVFVALCALASLLALAAAWRWRPHPPGAHTTEVKSK